VNMNRRLFIRTAALVMLVPAMTILSARLRADTGTCGGQTITLPFTDVMNSSFFCQIAEAYFSGLTNGTTPTTFDPNRTVDRGQMAAFITRTMDQSLRRGSRRAALNQWWTPQGPSSIPTTPTGSDPVAVASDGADLWVVNEHGSIVRVRASDRKLLSTFTAPGFGSSVLVARGLIYAARHSQSGTEDLYSIDPAQTGGAATFVVNLGTDAVLELAFDGNQIWASTTGGAVYIVSFGGLCFPPCVVTKDVGSAVPLQGILFDGSNIWVTHIGDNSLKKLDSSGNVLFSVTVGFNPREPVFDGINIWVPNNSISSDVTVVRVKDAQGDPLMTPFVLATLTGNGLDFPYAAAFDGERILVTSTGERVSLWRATDLVPLGNFSTGNGTYPLGACSDGINFWVAFYDAGKLARF